MLRFVSSLAALFSILTFMVPAWGADAAAARPQAVSASPEMAVPADASFADLYRSALEAEDAFAGPGPSAQPLLASDELGVPLGVRVAQTPRRPETGVRSSGPQSAARDVAPRGGWIMLLSGLAIVGFIARRRSMSVAP